MTQVTNIPYDNLEVGQQASLERAVEERDIQLFAAVSGDNNPVHLDAAFAAETMFKERIARGMFSGRPDQRGHRRTACPARAPSTSASSSSSPAR